MFKLKDYIVCILVIILSVLLNRTYNHYRYKEIKVKSLENINAWIYHNIKAMPEKRGQDYWQYPDETMYLKSGDCEDMAILFREIAERKLKLNVNMLWVVSPDRSISHMVIEYQGNIYDPMECRVYPTSRYLKSYIIYEKYNKKRLYKEIKNYRVKL